MPAWPHNADFVQPGGHSYGACTAHRTPKSGSRSGMILALIANEGGPADQQRQNRKRVRPPGSVAKVTIAERGSMRYTFHGGGPCDGALNGAVMPAPLSSGSAGQPCSAQAFVVLARASGSVTRAASPST